MLHDLLKIDHTDLLLNIRGNSDNLMLSYVQKSEMKIK